MIERKVIVDNAPEYVGTVRVNHTGCPAGEDLRRRLYLTRKPDLKTILAYCHNCQEAGVAREQDKLIFGGAVTVREKRQETELPDCDPVHFSKAAMAWLAQYGIKPPDWESLNFGFEPDQGRLVMPVWGDIRLPYGSERYTAKEILGYQSRRLGQYDASPKYLTAKFSGTTELETTILNEDATRTHSCVVLVEDLVSAIKVSKVARLTVPMYGCHVRSERILELSRELPVIVWLDNDNPTVMKQASRIHHLVRAFGMESHLITDKQDPKKYTTYQIDAVLKGRVMQQETRHD